MYAEFVVAASCAVAVGKEGKNITEGHWRGTEIAEKRGAGLKTRRYTNCGVAGLAERAGGSVATGILCFAGQRQPSNLFGKQADGLAEICSRWSDVGSPAEFE